MAWRVIIRRVRRVRFSPPPSHLGQRPKSRTPQCSGGGWFVQVAGTLGKVATNERDKIQKPICRILPRGARIKGSVPPCLPKFEKSGNSVRRVR